MLFSPFEQFELNSIYCLTTALFTGSSIDSLEQLDFTYTNSSHVMVLVLGIFLLVLKVSVENYLIAPKTALANIFLGVYRFVMTIVVGNVGNSNLRYFPFITTVFLFICVLNLFGMVPYSFTVTSHISVTFTLAFSICVALFILGVQLHGFTFFKSFLPEGTPLALAPLLITIEIVSYLSHSVSLSVRLFANMLSGHAILKILSGFVYTLISLGGVYSLVAFAPFLVVFALTGMECCIAVLQAYVFTVLTCIYLKDAIYPH